jgi:hypothetical protein
VTSARQTSGAGGGGRPEPAAARAAPAAALPRTLEEMARFVGFGPAESETVRRTAALVLEHEARLTAALYDHFLAHPRAARFFLQEDGTPDLERIERRKHSLGRWLRETATAALGHETAYYLLGIGLSHSHRTWGHGGSVPPELMVGALSLTQTALARLFEAHLPGAEALAASTAWNKLLLVQLSVFLVGYLLPPPDATG